jgi:exodeoxyribonuclease VII large subunit
MSKAARQANLPEFSVSELSAALKRTVEGAFPFVRVRGEISGLKNHSSGHIYFDLKDDKSVLNAVVWRGTASSLKVRPQAGIEVVCTGRISTYAGSSRYQIIVEQVELAGIGALMAMLEARRKALAAEGLFAEERKKKLPFLPDVIGVITSPTGAVIRDIMHRLNERFPRRVLLWPVAVQGEKAAAEIAAAIHGFNALPIDGAIPKPDLLIVARGGGSIEDLMAFNEEIVVRAAADSGIPLISAVGHETDTTLIDFAADRRAPTPTAAAEMAVPVRTELLAQTLDLERRNLRSFSRGLSDRRKHLTSLARALPRADGLFANPRQRFDRASDSLTNALRRNVQEHRRRFTKVESLVRGTTIARNVVRGREKTEAAWQRLDRRIGTRLTEWKNSVAALGRLLDTVSHKAVLQRGFALVRGADGNIRRKAAQIVAGERLTLTFSDGTADATAGTSGSPGGERPKRPKREGQATLF